MGYFTQFELQNAEPESKHAVEFDYKERNELRKKILNAVKEHVGYDPFEDTHTWYDHVEDMVGISTQFPNVLITVKGNGEDSGDIWLAYFFNGQYQVELGIITFEPFNRERLQKYYQGDSMC